MTRSNVLDFPKERLARHEDITQDFCEVYLIVDCEETRQVIVDCMPIARHRYYGK